jgi:hypothetical protein
MDRGFDIRIGLRQGTGTQPQPLPDAPMPQLSPRPTQPTLEQPDNWLSGRCRQVGQRSVRPDARLAIFRRSFVCVTCRKPFALSA